jgi:signal transduction histidine kinase
LINEGINDGNRSTQDSLEALRRNTIRLKNLANDILDVSRIEAGKLELNKEKLNLTEKIRNVVKDISNTNPQAAAKGVTIQFLNNNNKPIATKSDIGTGLGLFIAKRSKLMGARSGLRIIQMEKVLLFHLHCH